MKIPEKMKVVVTEEDIANGKRKDSSWCPIARAVSRAVDAANPQGEIGVSLGGISLYQEGGRITDYRLPDEADDFIRSFDGGAPVKPIEFEVAKSPEPKRWEGDQDEPA